MIKGKKVIEVFEVEGLVNVKKEELEKAMEGFIRIVIEIIEHKDEVINILEEYEGMIKRKGIDKSYV
mgnify:CR=1 FL=1